MHTDADLQLISDHALDAKMRTSIVFDVGKWQQRFAAQLIKNERAHPGYIATTAAALRGPPADELAATQRAEPADAFKRLYTAKWNDMARTGLPHADRVEYAMDYAASEVYRCNIGPLPVGGVVALEDALRAELRESRFP